MELKELQVTKESLEKTRVHSSLFCEKAYELIAKAEKNQFTNKVQLQNAAKLFIQALRRYRNQAEPFVGLGYIHILMADFNGAQKFLKQALALEPENESARDLMEYTKQPFVPEKTVDDLTADDFDDNDRDKIRVLPVDVSQWMAFARVCKFPRNEMKEGPDQLDISGSIVEGPRIVLGK